MTEFFERNIKNFPGRKVLSSLQNTCCGHGKLAEQSLQMPPGYSSNIDKCIFLHTVLKRRQRRM